MFHLYQLLSVTQVVVQTILVAVVMGIHPHLVVIALLVVDMVLTVVKVEQEVSEVMALAVTLTYMAVVVTVMVVTIVMVTTHREQVTLAVDNLLQITNVIMPIGINHMLRGVQEEMALDKAIEVQGDVKALSLYMNITDKY